MWVDSTHVGRGRRCAIAWQGAGPALQTRNPTALLSNFFDHRAYSRCVIFRARPGEQPRGMSRQSTPKPARLAAVRRLGNASHRSTGTLVRLAKRGKYKYILRMRTSPVDDRKGDGTGGQRAGRAGSRSTLKRKTKSLRVNPWPARLRKCDEQGVATLLRAAHNLGRHGQRRFRSFLN